MQVNEDEDEADAEVIYGGSFEKPELKALVKKEVSLALLRENFCREMQKMQKK